jgi:hypothetical protein
MEYEIDLHRAQTRHPEQVQAIHTDLNGRLIKASKPGIAPEDILWQYSWAKAIGGPGGTLENLHIALSGKIGRRRAALPIGAHDLTSPTPRADIPPEVLDVHTSKKPPISERDTAHLVAFDYTHPVKGSSRGLIWGAYSTKSGEIYALTLTVGEEWRGPRDHILLRIDSGHLAWSGILHSKALDRLVSCPVGDTFRYRNKPLVRLGQSDIEAALAGPSRSLTLSV